MYRLLILTSYCTNWRLYVVKISRHYLRFLEKLFLKKFKFWLSHGKSSKNYPIVLKLCTDVAFIYLQNELVTQKPDHYEKRYLIFKIFFLNFCIAFSQRNMIYRLEILTSYCTNWRLYVVKFSRDFLRFLEKIIFEKIWIFVVAR